MGKQSFNLYCILYLVGNECIFLQAGIYKQEQNRQGLLKKIFSFPLSVYLLGNLKPW